MESNTKELHPKKISSTTTSSKLDTPRPPKSEEIPDRVGRHWPFPKESDDSDNDDSDNDDLQSMTTQGGNRSRSSSRLSASSPSIRIPGTLETIMTSGFTMFKPNVQRKHYLGHNFLVSTSGHTRYLETNNSNNLNNQSNSDNKQPDAESMDDQYRFENK